MSKQVETMLETAIKLQVSRSLGKVFLGKFLLGTSPVISLVTSIVMKYIVSPALKEVYESIYKHIINVEAEKKMKRLQEANNENDISDAFTNL